MRHHKRLRRDGWPAARASLQWFGAQLALNVGWSAIFFGLRSPGWAFLEILALWLAIAATAVAFWGRSTFAALETAFATRFEQLFGGGFARLSLTDPADIGATGIEIVARPPGKKAQALAMLSGGERALTAVALLFAMLEVRPVPFCVLDEVDAALDEANIGRFSMMQDPQGAAVSIISLVPIPA